MLAWQFNRNPCAGMLFESPDRTIKQSHICSQVGTASCLIIMYDCWLFPKCISLSLIPHSPLFSSHISFLEPAAIFHNPLCVDSPKPHLHSSMQWKPCGCSVHYDTKHHRRETNRWTDRVAEWLNQWPSPTSVILFKNRISIICWLAVLFNYILVLPAYCTRRTNLLFRLRSQAIGVWSLMSYFPLAVAHAGGERERTPDN